MRVTTAVLLFVLVVSRALAQDKKNTAPAKLRPVVEIEDDVFSYEPAGNGSGPMWCYGSTCLARIGEHLFASGLETLKDCKPLNNCRWTLYARAANGWQLVQVDPKDRTREPCPLGASHDGRLFMSVNPTLVTDPNAHAGPARPEILEFASADPKAPYKTLLPEWDGKPRFTEHSYRSFAADGPNGELILFQNVSYTHSEWSFRDRQGKWSARGKLLWLPRPDPKKAPYGSTRVRVNYPNVVLKDRAVHFCGNSAFDQWERMPDVGDSHRKWGPRFRRMYYTWTPDVTTEEFRDWVEIANCWTSGGWLFTADLWVAADGAVHVLWNEYPIHKGLRDQRFPDIKRTQALKYAVVRQGKVVLRRTLLIGGEGASSEMPGRARFQVTPEGRLLVFYYVSGTDSAGRPLSENRLMELLPDGSQTEPVSVPLKHPLTRFFTAGPRGGSPPSKTIDLLGPRADTSHTISYARVRLE